MKKIIGFITILLLLAGGIYMYFRFHVLKAKDYKPFVAKEKNIVDLRPAIIAKLQQLVKDGSEGLYVLNIDKINPDPLHAKLEVTNASLSIDSNVMRLLDKAHKLPDDLFKIKLNNLHIDGLGIDNFLHKDSIVVGSIRVNKPAINVYHEARSYNKEERKTKETVPLFKKILGKMRMIAIGNVDIQHGTFIMHTKKHNQSTRLNDVAINLGKILIDSASQDDKNRFLFAIQQTLPRKIISYQLQIVFMFLVSAPWQYRLTSTHLKQEM